MARTFIFSYARADHDQVPDLADFYNDVRKAVRRRIGGEAPVGFFDLEDVDGGEQWRLTLSEALQTLPVMVTLFSASYFQGGYAETEFKAFLMRSNGQGTGILPVLWSPPANPLPQVANELQYHMPKDWKANPEVRAAYEKRGLSYIKRIGKHKDDYIDYCESLAERIIDLSAAPPPPLTAPPDLEALKKEALARIGPEIPRPPGAAGGGPRSVTFIYVAAKRTEIAAIGAGTLLDRYGTDQWQWMPYPPPEPGNSLGEVAVDVAHQKKLFPAVKPADDNVIAHLTEAQRSNSLVVLLIDPRSLKLASYRGYMDKFDKGWQHLNAAAIVVWDSDRPSDDLTRAAHDALAVSYAMKSRSGYFRDGVKSSELLRTEIADTLALLQSAMLKDGVVKRDLPGSPLTTL